MKVSDSKKIQASLVIPVFNNERTMVSQVNQCEQILKKLCSKYEIIICDDKSTDNSSSLLKTTYKHNPHFTLLFHSKNQGIAKTVRSLYKKAMYEYVVLFSVDGDWEPKDIRNLLMTAATNKADIVIGKRTYKAYSLYRKIISFFYNFLPALLFQVQTIDAGSIKAIRKEVIHTIPLLSKSVFFEAELIIRATKKNKKIMSIPIHFKKKINKRGSGGKLALVMSSLIDLINLRLRI